MKMIKSSIRVLNRSINYKSYRSCSYLNESQKELKEMLNKFGKDKIQPIAQEIDKTDRFPKELWPMMGELGFGVSKLIIGVVVEDEKVSVDDLTEHITKTYPTEVQSVEIMSFDKC